TQCETSTGILNPVEELSKTIQEKSDALIIVDGVSCVGGVEAEMDAWGVDVFVTGSQKAMMLPAGLTYVAVSVKAWQAIEKNKEFIYIKIQHHRYQNYHLISVSNKYLIY